MRIPGSTLMKRDKNPGLFLAAGALLAAGIPFAHAQESKPTVRHHQVAETVADDSSSPEVEQAETAMQHGDLATAETLLQKAVAAKPNDYRAWFDLGYVYNATQRTPDAIAAYRKAVAAKPDVFESNLNLGLLLAKQGETAEASKYLQAATQLKPTANPEQGLARAWQALGRVQESADPKQAAAAYNESAKLNPKSVEPHLGLAGLAQKQHDFDGATLEYQKALELDPKSTDALAGLASVDIAQKKYTDAEGWLRKLLEVDPQNQAARVQLGQVLAAAGKHDQAAQELQAGAQANPNDPQAAMELGRLYLKGGKNAEAEQQYRLALQKLPRDPDVHFALGSVLMRELKYTEAQQEFIAAVTLKPDFGEAYGSLAVAAAQNKNYSMALMALDDRAKYLAEVPATYFLRATTFDNLKAIPQAVENYQRFLAVADGKFPDQEWQARHRLIAIDPKHADKYRVKK